ncbi:acetyltransferase [Agrilactobacillus composti DSM 18527 = JCM 14202]|nr:acetyltransferase [Agrilactobacillus composti DSM 18527 = JCM 14202]
MENPHEHLRIKSVPVSDVEQFNDLLRYVFQVTNQDLIESGYEEGELVHAKQPILEKSDVIGWYNQHN